MIYNLYIYLYEFNNMTLFYSAIDLIKSIFLFCHFYRTETVES